MLAQLLQHREHALRAERAVGPERGDRQAAQRGAHLPRAVPAQGVPVGGEGGLGQHRDLRAGHVQRHPGRLDQLVEVAERLQHEQVHPGLDQGAHLVPQRRLAVGGGHPPALLDGDRRPDRTGHQHRATGGAAASLATRTPAALTCSARSASPCASSRSGPAPNVLVCSSPTPAAR